jgi:Flp pilus assembly pilin Flp
MRRKYLLLILLFIGITTILNAQTWSQIGSDIEGEYGGDNSGNSVSLSSDGSIVAIGASYNDGKGHVRIYQNIFGIWSQIGEDIDGEAAGDLFGFAVSLSSNGSVVAIGAKFNDGNGDNSGHVRIYQNIDGTWTQIGADIDGEATDDRSGEFISLSANGSIVAIGTGSGYVRVYQNIVGVWTQVGSDLDGEAESVSLSSDGSIVATGAPSSDGNGSNSGRVRVFKNISGTWTQIGVDIDGETEYDFSGWAISLSSDGLVVAIGAPDNDGNGENSGHVRIFQNISDNWVQIGSDIDGEAENDFYGWAVSLNSDGSNVAIGSYISGVRIYQNVEGIWMQIGDDVFGKEMYDRFGNAVSLNSDGLIIACGAPETEMNHFGYVSVLTIMSVITSQPLNQTNICYEDEVNFSLIAENTDTYQWLVSTDGGDSWDNLSNNETYSGTATNSIAVSTDISLNNYQYQCYLTGPKGNATSKSVILSFDSQKPIVNCKDNQEVAADETDTYEVNGSEFDFTSVFENCEVSEIINDFNSNSELDKAILPLGTTTITWTITDEAGNENECSFDVHVNDYNGINDLEEIGISIYPNPTTGIVKLNFSDNKVEKMKVSDIAGKTIIEKTVVQKNEILDLSENSKGIYIITVETDKGDFTSKIIKQ